MNDTGFLSHPWLVSTSAELRQIEQHLAAQLAAFTGDDPHSREGRQACAAGIVAARSLAESLRTAARASGVRLT